MVCIFLKKDKKINPEINRKYLIIAYLITVGLGRGAELPIKTVSVSFGVQDHSDKTLFGAHLSTRWVGHTYLTRIYNRIYLQQHC